MGGKANPAATEPEERHGANSALAHLRYARVVARHKRYVLAAGLRVGGVPLWRLLVHDWTKLTPAEWGPYARRFGSGRAGKFDKSGDPGEFHRAWAHHWHRNPHHWEHWLRTTDHGAAPWKATLVPVEMPLTYVHEMVADWIAASRAYGGPGAGAWYLENKWRITLHPRTRSVAEELLRRHA